MIAGTRLGDTTFMGTMERVAAKLVESGFTLREGTVLLSTIYTFTLAFVMEEQAVFPRPGERSPAYDLANRAKRLEEAGLPLLKQAGPILFDKFERRYRESVALIIRGEERAES